MLNKAGKLMNVNLRLLWFANLKIFQMVDEGTIYTILANRIFCRFVITQSTIRKVLWYTFDICKIVDVVLFSEAVEKS